MKPKFILISLFLFQTGNQLIAQVNNDANLNSIPCDSLISFDKRSVFSSVDSLYPLNIKYSFTNGNVIHGKIFFYSEHENATIVYPHLVGVYPPASKGLDYCFNRSDRLVTKVLGSFDNGMPCSEWIYSIWWKTDLKNVIKNSPYEIRKEAHYHNGLLHGTYRVMKRPDRPLYVTTFTNGTGYYKDYYPTYDEKELVRVEGALVNGVRDGVWLNYIRSDNGDDFRIFLKEVYLEYFDNGKLLYEILLKSDSEVKDILKKAVEWERRPKKARKGKENPYLK